MDSTIIIALISGLCVGIPSVIATMMSNNKSNTLVNYRLEELTKQVEKHNSVVERMALQEKETMAMSRKLDELQQKISHRD